MNQYTGLHNNLIRIVQQWQNICIQCLCSHNEKLKVVLCYEQAVMNECNSCLALRKLTVINYPSCTKDCDLSMADRPEGELSILLQNGYKCCGLSMEIRRLYTTSVLYLHPLPYTCCCSGCKLASRPWFCAYIMTLLCDIRGNWTWITVNACFMILQVRSYAAFTCQEHRLILSTSRKYIYNIDVYIFLMCYDISVFYNALPIW